MTTSVLAGSSMTTTRPVPWHRLAWVCWRRYRTTLIAVVALLGIIAIFLLLRGHQMRDAYAAVKACAPQASASCRFGYQTFRDNYQNPGPFAALFVWLPALIGAFAGAPLLARELETGTFRYAWTQGVGRTRWVIALIVSGALGVAALTAGLGILLTWYQRPLVNAGIHPRLHASTFPTTGLAVIGWGLFAFALGVFVGLLVRRVLPAVAITLAAWTGLAVLTASVFRPNYAAPLVTSNDQLPVTALSIDQWWTKGGVRATDAQLNQVLQTLGVQVSNGGSSVRAGPGSSNIDPFQYLMQHGYLQMTSYQPDNRYWPFQWIEFGWLTILSALLIGASIWLLRRRPA